MTDKDTAFFEDMLKKKNYLGAYHFIRDLQLSRAQRSAYAGVVVQAIMEELSVQPRQNRERIVFLRSILTYVSKEFPGLAGLYREQLRLAQGKDDVLGDLFKGVRNVADVAAGRKTVEEGIEEAADDIRQTFEGAVGSPFDTIAKGTEKAIVQGLDSIADFFNSITESPGKKDGDSTGERKADTNEKVEVKIENADDPIDGEMKDAEKPEDE